MRDTATTGRVAHGPPDMTHPALPRILVTGSRHWTNTTVIAAALHDITRAYHDTPIVLVHGAAHGADTLAAAWWSRHHIGLIEPHPADWTRHGRAAGPIRNQHMVSLGADLAVGFLLPNSRGTRDCLTRAARAGIPTREIWAPGTSPATAP